MKKIKIVSLCFKWLFIIIFVALPIFNIIGWVYAPQSWSFFANIFRVDVIPRAYSNLHHPGILHELTVQDKVLGFTVSLLPLAIILVMLYSFIKLFSLYQQGEIFSANNVRYLRNIGYTLLFTQLINPFYEVVMGIVLTWHNPSGHKFATITLDQTNLGILLVAALVILISWIMAEGCKLREEQQLTI